MVRRTHVAAVLIAGLFLAGGCESGSMWGDDSDKIEARAPADQQSLYHRLGGEEGIRKVVDDLVAISAPNPAVNFTRQGHPNQWQATDENVRLLKERLVQFIGSATGGPQIYRGKDMVTAHKGMEITEAEFNAFAKDVEKALDMNNVPKREQKELMSIIEGTRSAIVQAGKNP